MNGVLATHAKVELLDGCNRSGVTKVIDVVLMDDVSYGITLLCRTG